MTKRLVAVVAIAAAFVVAALEVTAQTSPNAGAGTPPAKSLDRGSIRFQHLDADHDGKLSRAEAAKSTFLSKHFDEIDTNHDGFITPDEKRAAWKARIAARSKPRSAQAQSAAMAMGHAPMSPPAAAPSTPAPAPK